jgi:MFS family permease
LFSVFLLSGILTFLTGVAPVRYIGFCLFFLSLFVTFFFPVGLVALTKVFDKETRSMAIGIVLACSVAFGGGLIPFLLGFAGDLLSFRFGISVLGVLVGLSSLLILSMKELK